MHVDQAPVLGLISSAKQLADRAHWAEWLPLTWREALKPLWVTPAGPQRAILRMALRGGRPHLASGTRRVGGGELGSSRDALAGVGRTVGVAERSPFVAAVLDRFLKVPHADQERPASGRKRRCRGGRCAPRRE